MNPKVGQFDVAAVQGGRVLYCVGKDANHAATQVVDAISKNFDLVVQPTEWDSDKVHRLMRAQHEAWRYWHTWNSKEPRPEKEPPRGPSMLIVLRNIFASEMHNSPILQSLVSTTNRTNITVVLSSESHVSSQLFPHFDTLMFTSVITDFNTYDPIGIGKEAFFTWVGELHNRNMYPWTIDHKKGLLARYLPDKPFDPSYQVCLNSLAMVAARAGSTDDDDEDEDPLCKRTAYAKKVFSDDTTGVVWMSTVQQSSVSCLDSTRTVCKEGGMYTLAVYDTICDVGTVRERISPSCDVVDRVTSYTLFEVHIDELCIIKSRQEGNMYVADIFNGFPVFCDGPDCTIVMDTSKSRGYVHFYVHARLLSAEPRSALHSASSREWDALSDSPRPSGVFVQGRATYKGRECQVRAEIFNNCIVSVEEVDPGTQDAMNANSSLHTVLNTIPTASFKKVLPGIEDINSCSMAHKCLTPIPVTTRFKKGPIGEELDIPWNSSSGWIEVSSTEDFQVLGVRSTAPLESLEFGHNGARLSVLPMHIFEYRDEMYTFPHPLTYFRCPSGKFTVFPKFKDSKTVTSVSLVIQKGTVDGDRCVMPHLTNNMEFNSMCKPIKAGKSTLDISVAKGPCVGFLLDIVETDGSLSQSKSTVDTDAIDSVRLDLGHGWQCKLVLHTLGRSTVYASIDGSPFPFHNPKGTDFRRAPNMSRCEKVLLHVVANTDMHVRIRPMCANILIRQSDNEGMYLRFA